MRDWLEKRRTPMPKPPPFDLFWNFRRRADTDENAIRAANAAMLWRSRPEMTRRRLAVRYSNWLTRFPIKIIGATCKNGPAAKREFGRGFFRQLHDQIWLATRRGVPCEQYFKFAGAYRKIGETNLCMVSFAAYANVLRYILLADLSAEDLDIQDKAAFARHCRSKGFPHPRIIAIVTEKGPAYLDERPWKGSLPPQDIFSKLARGGSGIGAARWRYSGDGAYSDGIGRRFMERELFAALRKQARVDGDDVVIQECLVNHPDLERLVGRTVSSIRIVSARNERSEPEIVEANFLTPPNDSVFSSNTGMGGFDFRVDHLTGTIEVGAAPNFVVDPVFQTTHPTTGAVLTGRVIPGWKEACALAVEMHRSLPRHALIGWDFAYTPNGVVVLEANYTPTPHLNEFFGSRLGELVAWNARRAIGKVEPLDSRWRVGADL